MNKSFHYKDEHSFSYAEYGNTNGYPILINHGLIASIHDPDLFEELIQLGARLISVARPGYGESSPYGMQNIAEWGEIASVLIDELHITQFDVLGMSSGSPYSYAIAYKLPEKVRNLYIFSGIPALYHEEVQSQWPFEINKNTNILELQSLAHQLFFSNLSQEDMQRDDIKDSMMNQCFGIAQDLMIRCLDWGFQLNEIYPHVYMQHNRQDPSVPFTTALLTSKLLPNCTLDVQEDGEHFSKDALDKFIETTISPRIEREKHVTNR